MGNEDARTLSTIEAVGSSFGIHLTVEDYAKIGLLAVLDTRTKFSMTLCLKALSRRSYDEFLQLEYRQIRQIMEELLPLTFIDPELHVLVSEFERLRQESYDQRHKHVHALWSIGGDDEVFARDFRRNEDLRPADLDIATTAVRELAEQAHACVRRVGALMADATIPEGIQEDRGPRIYWNDRWFRF